MKGGVRLTAWHVQGCDVLSGRSQPWALKQAAEGLRRWTV